MKFISPAHLGLGLTASLIFSHGCSSVQEATTEDKQAALEVRRQETQNNPNLPPAAKAAALRDIEKQEQALKQEKAIR